MHYLEEQGYAESTRKRLLAYYKVFEKYAAKHGITHFTLEAGKEFLLKHHRHQWVETEKLTIAQNYLQRHIQILHEFQKHGAVVSKKRRKRFFQVFYFEGVINEYLQEERNAGVKESTIEGKRYTLSQIFEYLENTGITDTKSITATCIYDFLAYKSHYSLTSKERCQYLLRSLIKYLHKNELCKDELLQLFPVISIHTKNSYPSYFKPEDITKILKCVDINAQNGKRDYLVLLLAASLGIRCGDIRNLKLKNVDWNIRKIEFIQSKTNEAISLTFSDEIFYALIDYIKNERPACEREELFICGRAPYQPFTNASLYHLLQKYITAADIKLDDNQKHGLHAMRSSLASNMLRDGVPILVIANALGHKHPDTTNSYIKIDLDGLRKSALEVPVQ
jgi:site-specific recombinase XerD